MTIFITPTFIVNIQQEVRKILQGGHINGTHNHDIKRSS